jgi:hypothetical protein
MKKLFLLALLLGSAWLLPAQNESHAEEITKLKKQVIELRNKNARLEKTVNTLSVKSSESQNSLSAQLSENAQKLAALQDTMRVREKMLKHARGTALVALKSLKHRKKLAITGAIIAIIVVGGISWILIRKYKADTRKMEQQLSDLKKLQQEELEKAKNAMIQQLNSLKEVMEQKLSEQERRIAEQERRITDIKNKG